MTGGGSIRRFDTVTARDYHSLPVGTSGARQGRWSPGVLSFISTGKASLTNRIAGACT